MKIAVLPVYCSDVPRTSTISETQIKDVCQDVARYFRDQSGGRENLEYRVFDWFKLELTRAQWTELQFAAGDTVVPMIQTRTGINLSAYEHFVLLIDLPEAVGGAWDSDDPTLRYLHLSGPQFSPALLAHELGHLAGSDHADLGTPQGAKEYMDSFCVMGSEGSKYTFANAQLPDRHRNSGPGMVASTLRACNWLDFEQLHATVNLGLGDPARAEAVVELAALDGAPAPGWQGLPVVAWSDGVASNARLLLEFRDRDGWDRALPHGGGSPGWLVAHLTSYPQPDASSLQIGAIGASPGAVLELPEASVTVTVTGLDPVRRVVTIKVSRRLKHVFSGGDGIVYAIADSGDLYWYRHEGHADGSFRWTDNHARKIGSGWNVKHAFCGADGVIYAIDANDDLLWNRHEGRNDGSGRWAHPVGRKVGAGWNFPHVFSGGDGVIYAINADHDLLWYRHEGRNDGSWRWTDDNGRKVGAGWHVKDAFSGGGGVIYAVSTTNDLLWYRHDGRDDGSFRWTDDKARKVGANWDVKHLFAGGNGVIYAIAQNEDLNWYRHEGRDDGSFRWLDDRPRKVGVGWNFKDRFDPGAGVIYAIGDDDALLWYRHDGRGDGRFRWRDDKARPVGGGWRFKQVFSGGDGTVYAINADDDLVWLRHDGQIDGAFAWTTGPAGKTSWKVGNQWRFKHVFSGRDGVIYAVNAANDLLWYRHDGRKDGTFRWVDDEPRKVGFGWDVKHVFYGGDGVIYAINAANDLLWYRHEGRNDGSWRWADEEPRKVGAGWDVKHVFSGGDGIIYAINTADDLLWYRHEGRGDGSFRWTDVNGRKVGAGWKFGLVFSG